MSDDKLYREAGGETKIVKFARDFVERVVEDPRVNGYLAMPTRSGVPLTPEDWAIKLAKMIGMLFGGPKIELTDRDGKKVGAEDYLFDVHKDFDIPDTHYSIIGTHLMRSALDAGYGMHITTALGNTMVAFEPHIVRRRLLGQKRPSDQLPAPTDQPIHAAGAAG